MKTQLSQAEKELLKLQNSNLATKYQCFKEYVLMIGNSKRRYQINCQKRCIQIYKTCSTF
jgi:beta-lactamase class D